MAQTLTARGINSENNTADDIVLADVLFNAGSSALILIGCDDSQGDPDTVVWGENGNAFPATKMKTVTNTTGGIIASLWEIKYVRRTLTQDITATWSATNTDRIIAAEEITESTVVDVDSSATQDASTAPNTGTAVTSTVAITMQVAFFVCNGRTSDAIGTVGDGHTTSQRDGSTPVSLVAHSTYESLTATGDVRGSKSGATSRDWASLVVAFTKRQTYTVIEVKQRLWPLIDGEDVTFVVESETAGDLFEVNIPVSIFDELTDGEVDDFILEKCTWHSDHILDGSAPLPDNDATRDIRMATFVNDEVVV